MKIPQAQGGNDAVYVGHIGVGGIIAVGRPVAVAVSPLVKGQHAVAFRQGQADKVPAVRLLADAVQHQNGWPAGFAPLQVVEVHPADGQKPIHGFIRQRKGNPHLPGCVVQRKPQGMRRHSR